MSDTDTWALPYQRLPLEQSKKEIRLIEFHFEGGDDYLVIDMDEEVKRPISLRMVKASLLEPPKFRALSYVWGPSTEGRRITLRVPQNECLKNIVGTEEEPLEQCEIDVTDNLFSALVHYRTMSSKDKPAFIWIDALCINQRDNDEKSWQVAMMRDVYRSADMVMAWLGPYPEPVYFRPGELVKTFKALAHEGLARFGRIVSQPLASLFMGEEMLFFDTRLVRWLRRVKFVDGPFSGKRGDGTYEISAWALTAFQMLAFWWRVWILQEVVLANEILFTWATWSITCEDLSVALRIVAKARQLAGKRGPLPFTRGIRHVLPSEETWIRASNPEEETLCAILHRREYHDENEISSLWELIHWSAVCGHLQATMPADHVFGLFGVANDVEELGFRMDYSRDVKDIYTELASSSIEKKGLVVLTDVQWPKQVANLPSWAPDWSALSRTEHRAGIWSSHVSVWASCNYAGTQAYRFTVSGTGLPALVVGGSTITTVQSLLPVMRNTCEGNPRLIRRIWNIQAKLLAVKDTIEQSATAYRTSDDRHTAFASTLVAGGWERGRSACGDAWSLKRLVKGYRLLLDPVSTETSLNALWRRRAPSRQMVCHTILACYPLTDPEFFFRETPGARTVSEISRNPGPYYQTSFDDYADQVLGTLVHVEGAEKTMADIAVFLDRMGEVGLGRRLFLSVDGYLGLGPAVIQNGDVVAYLDGAEVPFVLRPLPTGDFTLVGETYVYGLMDRDLPQSRFPHYEPSPESGRTIHHCPKGEQREFVIV